MALAHFGVRGDVHDFVRYFEREIASLTLHQEARAERAIDGARLVVRVYERYSFLGSNRLSLSLSMLSVGDEVVGTVVTSGGSRGVFFKLNRFGEDAFLEKALDVINRYRFG